MRLNWETGRHHHQISTLWFPVIVVVYCAIFYACYANFYSLPSPNLSEDISTGDFNARVARKYLTGITQYGPKVAGSVFNEKNAVAYLQAELAEIQRNMHPNHELKVDVQVADGAVQLSSSSSTYQGVRNVVVRLWNAGDVEPQTALLINSHYDTVAVSPGGGDAGTMIAVMLETLRVLATQPETFGHAIIFLFNGAEEISLIGSHAFVTQHEWAKSCKVVLNLDSAGNGGREILFQASKGHSWLMKYYKRHAPHPFSSALGEELFQAGAIPSDTDFRIFRDFGGIPGMDFAYITNGYVYHTKHDTAEIVPDGTLQHTGNNILALTRVLANAEELRDPESHMDDDAVFFDYLNAFMFYYTQYEAIIINSVICAFCIVLQIVLYLMPSKDGKSACSWYVPVYLLVHLISIGLGVGLVVLAMIIYESFDWTMFWYSNSFLVFPVYLCPLLFGMAIGPAILRRFSQRVSPWDSVLHSLNFQSLILVIFLIIATAFGIRSGFMFLVPLCFFVVTIVIQIVFKFCNIGARSMLVVHYLIQVVPFTFFAYWTVIALATFIPITGRNGANSEADLIIVGFTVAMGLLMAGFLIPTIPMFKSPVWATLIFVLIWAVGMILVATPVGFPYAKDTAPQRQLTYVSREIIVYVICK